jgi:hypothetical protein
MIRTHEELDAIINEGVEINNKRRHIGLDMGKNHGQQIDRRRVDSDIMVQAERPPRPPEIATMEEPNRQS